MAELSLGALNRAVGDLAGDTETRSRPLIAIGGGGFGTKLVTATAAEVIQRFGVMPPNVKFLAFDVMPVPPVVKLPSQAAVQLQTGLQYLQLGQGASPALLRKRKDEGRLDPSLAELVDLQPGGHFARSLENGSENERLVGHLALRLSRNEVRRMIRRNVTEVAATTAPTPAGSTASAEAPVVIIAASVAGGVGSAIALPLAAEVRRAMQRLGMNVEAATFVAVLGLPECFPVTRMRLSNAFDALRDIELVQRRGVFPA